MIFNKNTINLNHLVLMLTVGIFMLIISDAALASNMSGGGLPSDDYLTRIRQSVTGPWAFTFAIIGIVGAGATLIFGGDLNGFLRTVIFLVLVLGFVVAAQNTLSAITGQGAEIALLSDGLSGFLRARVSA